MDLQYVKNQLPDGSVDIFLFGEIGGSGIAGERFADEIRFLNENEPGINEIRVRINSNGGLVTDGLSIISAIRASKIPVNTYIDGIAASIAGVIAQAGRKRFMNDFGLLMIHSPFIENTTNGTQLSDRQKEAIKQIEMMLTKIFENNSRKSKEELLTVMRREVWFDAGLAFDWGLVDEIVKTDREVGQREPGKPIENVLNEIQNAATELHNLNVKPKQQTMLTITNHLQLDDAANETQVLDAIKKVENSLTEAEANVKTANNRIAEQDAEIDALKKQINDLETQIGEREDADAVTFVENCIDKGIFEADQKEDLINEAKNDFAAFKTIVEKVNTKPAHVDITDGLKTGASDGETTETFRDLDKNNPAKLERIRNEQPDLYAKLYKDEYNVEYKG